MTTDMMRHFLAVYDSHNITKSSEQLHISQQGLSASICRLEKEKRGEAYLKSHKEYLASRMIMEALDMLAQAAWKQEEDELLAH